MGDILVGQWGCDAIYDALGIKQKYVSKLVLEVDWNNEVPTLYLQCCVTKDMIEGLKANHPDIKVGDTVVQKGTLHVDDKGGVSIKE